MKIKIINDDVKLTLPFPSILVFNSLTATLISHAIGESYNIDRKQLIRLFAEARRYKRHHKHFHLVDISSADGQIVQIDL